MFQIDDDEVQEAFAVLHSGEHAKARAAYEYTEKRLKVILARAKKSAEGKTISEREDSALLSREYQAELETFKVLAEVYYTARDKREAAAAVIDAFRTQQSDRRAMRNAA